MSFHITWDSPKASLEFVLERMKGHLMTAEADAKEAREVVLRAEAEIAVLKEKIAAFAKHIEGIV